ncbi:Uncharacterized protein dnm_069920 [Desulfonema magnum]|uniref:Uncharacterized protein n=1 Tax=Desulfonema magnum TaxID=45655 RepID=A0A975GRH7_9BACT|nr:Uncharacterized protein dnm_069920 [Desulfonema magnum]
MRRPTEHVKQLKKMYSIEDGRLQGESGWEKLQYRSARFLHTFVTN